MVLRARELTISVLDLFPADRDNHCKKETVTSKVTVSWINFGEGVVLKPFRHVLAPHASQRIADLAERDVILHTLDEQRHQIVGAFGRVHQFAEQLVHSFLDFSISRNAFNFAFCAASMAGQRSGVRGSFLPSPGID
jgi:hypothetical protein